MAKPSEREIAEALLKRHGRTFARELGDDANSLVRLVEDREFPRLVAAIVRVQLEGDHDGVLEEAGR